MLDGAKANGGCLATRARAEECQRHSVSQQPDSDFDLRPGGTQAGYPASSRYRAIPAASTCSATWPTTPTISGSAAWTGRSANGTTSTAATYIYDFTALSLFDGKNALTTGTPGNQDRSQTMTIGDTYTFAGGTKVNCVPRHLRPAPRQPRVGAEPVQPQGSGREHVHQHSELHAAEREQLLRQRIQRGLRHLRAGELRHQHLSGGGRFHVDQRPAPVRLRLRRPQGSVQFLQQPAVQRPVHVQRQHQRRRSRPTC